MLPILDVLTAVAMMMLRRAARRLPMPCILDLQSDTCQCLESVKASHGIERKYLPLSLIGVVSDWAPQSLKAKLKHVRHREF